MGFLGFGKKREVLDLTERYRKQQERLAEIKEDSAERDASASDSSSAFGFLGNMASASGSSSTSTEESTPEFSVKVDEKRRALSKNLLKMTEKLEDLSNQIYHLQQRIEVLERKADVGKY